MADQVDSMSDAELRAKLAEYGLPIVPITASTRKLVVNKLKKLMLDGKAKPRNSADSKAKNRRTLARNSSGEESNLDKSGTILPPANSKTPRIPSKKRSPAVLDDKGSESEDEKSPARTQKEVGTVTKRRRVTRTYAGNEQDDYETSSRSNVDAGNKILSSSFGSRSTLSDRISSTFTSNTYQPSTSTIDDEEFPYQSEFVRSYYRKLKLQNQHQSV